jgi:hypothetical protein
MKPIRIITPNFELLGEIDNYTSLQFTRRWSDVGEFELHVNRYMQHADKLQKNNLIILGGQTNKVGIIKHREIALDENGKSTENWVIKGPTLKGVLSQRITLPPSTTAYDNKQGDAETVMKHYVENNAVNPADVNRIIPNLIIADNQERGPTVSWQSRFKNLADELSSISLSSGVGWTVYLDIQQKTWVFDVAEGRDLTVDQSVNPPVIFSPEFDSLKTQHFIESQLNYKNYAYVAGQGEGVDRRVVNIGDSTGLDRIELFVDARDIEETMDVTTTDENGNETTTTEPRPEQDIINDLIDRGNQALAEYATELSLEGEILTNSPFKYEQDYDLGDIVTIQNKGWGVTMNSRITEIKETYEPDGFSLEATFGNSYPTFIDVVKRQINQFSNELRK